jgi:hypothetical protein
MHGRPTDLWGREGAIPKSVQEVPWELRPESAIPLLEAVPVLLHDLCDLGEQAEDFTFPGSLRDLDAHRVVRVMHQPVDQVGLDGGLHPIHQVGVDLQKAVNFLVEADLEQFFLGRQDPGLREPSDP